MTESVTPNPTAFQRHAEEAVRSALAERGIQSLDRDVLVYEAPFFAPGKLLAVRLRAPSVVVWLHEGEAGFEVGAHTRMIEASDYPNPDDLMDRFVAELKAALAKSERGAA